MEKHRKRMDGRTDRPRIEGRKEWLGWTCEITGPWRLIRLFVGKRSGQF